MNLKNNKGISLVALIITIIVMLIIAGIVLYNGTGEVKQAKTESVRTNMLLVQAQIKNYVEQAKFEGKKQEDGINGITVDDYTLTVTSEGVGVDGYVKITSSMSDLGLGKISADDYLISYNIDNITVDVYYVPGITDADGNTYYKLSDMH